MLIFSGFLLALGLLETVLAVVHDLADRWVGTRSDLHEVEVLPLGDLQRSGRGHDAQLSAVSADDADFLIADLFVDLIVCSCDTNTPPLVASGAIAPRTKKHGCKTHPRA